MLLCNTHTTLSSDSRAFLHPPRTVVHSDLTITHVGLSAYPPTINRLTANRELLSGWRSCQSSRTPPQRVSAGHSLRWACCAGVAQHQSPSPRPRNSPRWRSTNCSPPRAMTLPCLICHGTMIVTVHHHSSCFHTTLRGFNQPHRNTDGHFQAN